MDDKCAKRARLDAEGGAGSRASDNGGGRGDEILLPLFAGAATDNETRIPLGEEDHEEESSEVCDNATNLYQGYFCFVLFNACMLMFIMKGGFQKAAAIGQKSRGQGLEPQGAHGREGVERVDG